MKTKNLILTQIIILLIISTYCLNTNTSRRAENTKLLDIEVYQENKIILLESMTHSISFTISYRDESIIDGYIKITPNNSELINISFLASTCSFSETTNVSDNLGSRPLCFVASDSFNPNSNDGYNYALNISNNYLNTEANSIFFKIDSSFNIKKVKLTVLVLVTTCNNTLNLNSLSGLVSPLYPSFTIRAYSNSLLTPEYLIAESTEISGINLKCTTIQSNKSESYSNTEIPIAMEFNEFFLDSNDLKVTEKSKEFLKSSTKELSEGYLYNDSTPLSEKSFSLIMKVDRDINITYNWGLSFAGPWNDPTLNQSTTNTIYEYITSIPLFQFSKEYFEYASDLKDCYFTWANDVLTENNSASNNSENIFQNNLYTDTVYYQFSNFLKNDYQEVPAKQLVFDQEDYITISTKNYNEKTSKGHGTYYSFMLDMINQFVFVTDPVTSITTYQQISRATPQTTTTGYLGFNSNCLVFKKTMPTIKNLFSIFEIYINFYNEKEQLIRANRFFKLFTEGSVFSNSNIEEKDFSHLSVYNFYYYKINSLSNLGVCLLEMSSDIWNTNKSINTLVFLLQNITLLETDYSNYINNYPVAPLYIESDSTSNKSSVYAYGFNSQNFIKSSNIDKIEEISIANKVNIEEVEVKISDYKRYLGSYVLVTNFANNNVTKESESNIQHNLFIPVYCPIDFDNTKDSSKQYLSISTIALTTSSTSLFSFKYKIVNSNVTKNNYFYTYSYSNNVSKYDLSLYWQKTTLADGTISASQTNVDLFYTGNSSSPSSINVSNGIFFLSQDINLDNSIYTSNNGSADATDIIIQSSSVFYFILPSSTKFNVFGHSFNKGLILSPLTPNLTKEKITTDIQDSSTNPTFILEDINRPSSVANEFKFDNNFLSFFLFTDTHAVISNLVYNTDSTLENSYNNLNNFNRDILYFNVATHNLSNSSGNESESDYCDYNSKEYSSNNAYNMISSNGSLIPRYIPSFTEIKFTSNQINNIGAIFLRLNTGVQLFRGEKIEILGNFKSYFPLDLVNNYDTIPISCFIFLTNFNSSDYEINSFSELVNESVYVQDGNGTSNIIKSCFVNQNKIELEFYNDDNFNCSLISSSDKYISIRLFPVILPYYNTNDKYIIKVLNKESIVNQGINISLPNYNGLFSNESISNYLNGNAELTNIKDYYLIEIFEITPRIVGTETVVSVMFNINKSDKSKVIYDLNSVNQITIYFKNYLFGNYKESDIYCGINREHNTSCYMTSLSEYSVLYIQIDTMQISNSFPNINIYNLKAKNINYNSVDPFLITFDYIDSITNEIKNIYIGNGIFNLSTINISNNTDASNNSIDYSNEKNDIIYNNAKKQDNYLELFYTSNPGDSTSTISYLTVSNTNLNTINANMSFKLSIFSLINKNYSSLETYYKESKDSYKDSELIKLSSSNLIIDSAPYYLIIELSDNFDLLKFSSQQLSLIEVFLTEYTWKYEKNTISFTPYFPNISELEENEEFDPTKSYLSCTISNITSRSIIAKIVNNNFKTHENFAYFLIEINNIITPGISGDAGITSVYIVNSDYSKIIGNINLEFNESIVTTNIADEYIYEADRYSITSSNKLIIHKSTSGKTYSNLINFSDNSNNKHEINFIFRKIYLNKSAYSEATVDENTSFLYYSNNKNSYPSISSTSDINTKLYTINSVSIYAGVYTQGFILINNGLAPNYSTNIRLVSKKISDKVNIVNNDTYNDNDTENDNTNYESSSSNLFSVVSNGKPNYDYANVSSVKTKQLEFWVGAICGTLPGKYILYFEKQNDLEDTYFYPLPPVIAIVKFNINNRSKISFSPYIDGNYIEESTSTLIKTSLNGSVLFYYLIENPPVEKLEISFYQQNIEDNKEIYIKPVTIFPGYISDQSSMFYSLLSSSFNIFENTNNLNKLEYKAVLNQDIPTCFSLTSSYLIIESTTNDISTSSNFEKSLFDSSITFFDSSAQSETINNRQIYLNEIKFKLNSDVEYSLPQYSFVFCQLYCSSFQPVPLSLLSNSTFILNKNSINEVMMFKPYTQFYALNLYNNDLMYDLNFSQLLRNQNYGINCAYSALSSNITNDFYVHSNFTRINSVQIKPRIKLETKCFEYIFNKKSIDSINESLSNLKLTVYGLLRKAAQLLFSKNGFINDGCIVVIDSNYETEQGYDLNSISNFTTCSISNNEFYSFYNITHLNLNKSNNLSDYTYNTTTSNDYYVDSNTQDAYSICSYQLPDCPTNVNLDNRMYQELLAEISFWNSNSAIATLIGIQGFNGFQSIKVTSDNSKPDITTLSYSNIVYNTYTVSMDVSAKSSLRCYYYIGVSYYNEKKYPSLEYIINCYDNPYICGSFTVTTFTKSIYTNLRNRVFDIGNISMFIVCSNNFPYSKKFSDISLIATFSIQGSSSSTSSVASSITTENTTSTDNSSTILNFKIYTLSYIIFLFLSLNN